MFPRLIEIPLFGGIPINTYGFMIMIGFLLATYVGVRRAKPIGIDTDLLLDIGIISMIFGILGAKLNYVLQYPGDFGSLEDARGSIWNITDGNLHPIGALIGVLPVAVWFYRTRKEKKIELMHWKTGVLMAVTLLLALIGARALYIWFNPAEYNFDVYKSWQSGFVLYGGLAAAIGAGVGYTMLRGAPVGKIADLSAPSIMMGVAFGRIGCFLNGCCYGDLCDLPWAVKYPKIPVADEPLRYSPPYNHHDREYDLPPDADYSLATHPTQIYEFLATLGIFFVCSWLWKRRHTQSNGQIFMLMGMMYAVWRFIVEYLRDDPGRELASLPVTYSQGVSLLVFVISGVWAFLLMKRTRPTPDPANETKSESPTVPGDPPEKSDKS